MANTDNTNVTPAQAPNDVIEPAPKAPLFELGQCLKHLRSGGLYVVLALPDQVKFESDAKPAYAYQSVGDKGIPKGPIWIRAQELMEDGRFVAAPDVHVDLRGYQGHLLPVLAQGVHGAHDGVRFVAKIVSVEGAENLPEPRQWDCTAYLTTSYTESELSELVIDPDSALADTLRNDPAAPAWLKQWSGSARLRLSTR